MTVKRFVLTTGLIEQRYLFNGRTARCGICKRDQRSSIIWRGDYLVNSSTGRGVGKCQVMMMRLEIPDVTWYRERRWLRSFVRSHGHNSQGTRNALPSD